MVWSCLPFIRSDQNHLARHSEKGRQRRRWEDNIREWTAPEVHKVTEGSGKQGKMEEIGCKIICGAPTILAVKGYIMRMTRMYISY